MKKYKEEIEVVADKFGKTKGLVYIMEDGFDINCPVEKYVETCKKGYEAFNFDTFPLNEALGDARKISKK